MGIKRPPKGWFRIHCDLIVIDRKTCLFYTLGFKFNRAYRKQTGNNLTDEQFDILVEFCDWLEKK